MKKILSIVICLAMLLSSVGMPSVSAATPKEFTTSGGSVIFYATDTGYDTKTFIGEGYKKVTDSSAAGGAYLKEDGSKGSTPSSGSKLAFKVTADVEGRYTIWIRSKASSGQGSTFLDYDGSGYGIGRVNESGNWTWNRLVGGYYLKAGDSITVKMYPRDDEGLCFDEFIVTNKVTYLPEGVVKKGTAIANSTLSTNVYGAPTFFPPANTHPRVMFNAGDIEKIKTNAGKSANSDAKSHLDTLVSESFSGTRTGENNFSRDIENYIEANAFYYAVYGDEEKGRLAVNELINYLTTVKFDLEASTITRDMGCVIFKASEVYDWCYPLLSDSQKQLIIDCIEGIATGLEVGYPVTGQSSVVSHGSEAQILRDLLSFAIAVYDERPDVYNHIMGRIENQFVPARNYFYASNTVHQGTEYGWYRYYYDLYAEKLVRAMTGGEKHLFSDDIAQVGYHMIYSRRPDGRLFISGDEHMLNWAKYHGANYAPAKMAGDLFGDKYLKGEYRRMRGSDDFTNSNYRNDKSFNSVLWLIMNDPAVSFERDRTKLPLSRYFSSPNGMILARTSWEYQTETPTNTDGVAAMMKIGEHYASNHDHLDAGTFQLYYKGILASDSGAYDSYGNDHDKNYYKRTVAHNALTIYDSSEEFEVLGGSESNDGGQLWQDEPNTFETWTNGQYNRGSVLDHAIADDNSYSYIKGDITKAYKSSKADEVIRNMSFVPTDDENYPAIMVVYDKVTSKTNSQIKKFLLHTQSEPTISGTTTTYENTIPHTYSNATVNYGGKLTMNTLLPSGAKITKIGGSGSEYKVNGTNYAPAETPADYEEAGWGRIEVQAGTEGTTTEFLNVLAVSDAGNTAAFSSTLIQGTNLVGAAALDKVVMFADRKNRIDTSASFTVESGTDLDIMVFGVAEGRWKVLCDGTQITACDATADGGTIAFTGGAGTYTISLDNSVRAAIAGYDAANNPNADVWADLSGNGNDIPLTFEGHYWTGNALHVDGDGDKLLLPSTVVNAVNSDAFTIEFVVDNITQTNPKQGVSVFGDVRNSTFALYKMINQDMVYLKLPGWHTILKRPGISAADINGTHNIITVDKQAQTVKWYRDGVLEAVKTYTESGSMVKEVPLVSDGGSVDYKMIKFYDDALTEREIKILFAQ